MFVFPLKKNVSAPVVKNSNKMKSRENRIYGALLIHQMKHIVWYKIRYKIKRNMPWHNMSYYMGYGLTYDTSYDMTGRKGQK